MAIHLALDYFLCDRCPTEVIDDRISDILGEMCLLGWLFKLLPDEPFNMNHPVYFPRTYFLKITGTNHGQQVTGKEKYAE